MMLRCPLPELLYGGAAGGGKTDALLGDFAAGIERYGSAWQGVIFRRTYPMLEEVERRSLEIFGPAYGEKCYSIGNRIWKFPNGARLRFRFLEKDKDVYSYQGHQYSWVGFDELTQWPNDFCYTYLFTRLRSPSGAPVYFRAASNPGGPGHQWVKARWEIGKTPPLEVMSEVMPSGRLHKRVFIPARLRDNRILYENDPRYEDRINLLSDPVLRRALLEGDWNIFSGMGFPEWSEDVHIVEDHPIPDGVKMWRACDWGFEKPYCVLWFYADYDGNIFVCNELYGQGGSPNVGSREAASIVADKIDALESANDWWVPIGYLDPQCWAKDDTTPSIYDRLGGARMNWHKWAKGPGSRKNQKQVLHDYLKVTNGKSRLKIFRRCRHLIQTLPSLATATADPEDIDTDQEDHAYDALRGGLVKKVVSREERRRMNQMRQRHRVKRQRANVGRYGGW